MKSKETMYNKLLALAQSNNFHCCSTRTLPASFDHEMKAVDDPISTHFQTLHSSYITNHFNVKQNISMIYLNN